MRTQHHVRVRRDGRGGAALQGSRNLKRSMVDHVDAADVALAVEHVVVLVLPGAAYSEDVGAAEGEHIGAPHFLMPLSIRRPADRTPGPAVRDPARCSEAFRTHPNAASLRLPFPLAASLSRDVGTASGPSRASPAATP